MIKPDITYCTSLEEFYKEIVRIQQETHGDYYTKHHDALTLLSQECETIKELGVCQGGTLAALMLSNPQKKITGIDYDPKYFMPYKRLFIDYAEKHSIDFDFIEGDSLDKKLASKVDLLHIDTLHTEKHLLQELKIHAPLVKKYIVFHDTCNAKGSTGLLLAIARYITEVDQSWQIIDHFIHNVGYTVIKRIDRSI